MGCATVARIPSHTAATGGAGGGGGAIGACFTRLVLVHLFFCLRGQRLQVLNLFHNVIGAQAARNTRHTTCRSTQRAYCNIIQRAARNATQHAACTPPSRSRRRVLAAAAAGVLAVAGFVQCQSERAGRRTNQSYHRAPRARVWAQAGMGASGNGPKWELAQVEMGLSGNWRKWE
jgi:hypothetical protein